MTHVDGERPDTGLQTSEDVAMRIGYTPEQEELRRELRAYFTKLMTPERAEALGASDGEMGRGNVYRETVAPALASPIASARPRPAAAPVTTATWPDRSTSVAFWADESVKV